MSAPENSRWAAILWKNQQTQPNSAAMDAGVSSCKSYSPTTASQTEFWT
jgi:hypothetical protein